VNGPEKNVLRVLIADDHAPTRDDVRRVLSASEGFSICAEAADAVEAVQLALRDRPDVCLLDIRMPGNGVAATWEISSRLPDTKIVVFTVSDSDADLFAALRAGASGYLLKNMNLERLPHALRGAAEGEAPVQRLLVTRILERFQGSDPRRRRIAVDGVATERLTSREWEVLDFLSRGRSTAEIARDLDLSQSAVRVHIAGVVRKLGVADREAAVGIFKERLDMRKTE
jgi:DNA-binding NarL/FixJ family response regulator